MLPAWFASIAQVPLDRIVTVVPLTLHALEPVENVTALPEAPPVALTVKGGSVVCLSGSGAKLIAWSALFTVSEPEPLLGS